jgi:hypothetical protein
MYRTRTVVAEAHGDRWLRELALAGPDGESTIPVDGLYVLMGVAPLALAARRWLRCDRHGCILTAHRFLAIEGAPPA